jgi:hypothetical protein
VGECASDDDLLDDDFLDDGADDLDGLNLGTGHGGLTSEDEGYPDYDDGDDDDCDDDGDDDELAAPGGMRAAAPARQLSKAEQKAFLEELEKQGPPPGRDRVAEAYLNEVLGAADWPMTPDHLPWLGFYARAGDRACFIALHKRGAAAPRLPPPDASNIVELDSDKMLAAGPDALGAMEAPPGPS